MSRPPLAATSSGRLQGVGDGTRAPSLTTSNSSSSLPKKPKPAPSRPAATTSAVKPKAGVASTSSTKPSAKASSSSTTSAARGNRAQTTASGGATKKPAAAAAAKKKPVESSSSEEEYEEEIVVMIIQDGEECEAFVGSDDEYEYEVVEEIEEYVDVEDEEISDEALFDRYNPLLSAAAAAKRLAAALVEEQDEEDAEEGSEFVKRLVDYFVVCGLSDSMALDEADGEETRTLTSRYKPTLLDRYPRSNYKSAPLPPHVWMFCFPDGIRLTTEPKPNEFFVVVLTEIDGARFFASCLIFYEPLPPALAEKVEGYRPGKAIYMPKCIALFSHHPYYQLFRSILIETHLCFISSISRESASSSSQAPLRTRAGTALNDVRNSKNPRFLRSRSSRVGELSHASCPVEFIIRLITKEVPFPPPASEVSFTVGSTEFWFQTPCLDELPYSDAPLTWLFDMLGVEVVLSLLACLLQEKKVCLVSEQKSLLTAAAETLQLLFYPFQWPHVYIPVLSRWLLDFIQAPTPFIMGVPAQLLPYMPEVCEVIMVDLDKGTVQSDEPLSQLPEAAGKRLFDSITKTLANWPRPSCRSARPDSVDNEFHEDPARQLELRCSFIAFFVELFGCYQEHLTFLRRYPTPVPIFNKAAFLKASHPSAIKFLDAILETQAFSLFLDTQHAQAYSVFEKMIAVSQKFRDSMADEQALALLEKQQREIVLPTNATRKMKAKLSVTQWSGPSPSYTETFPKLDPRLVKTVNVEKPAWISKTRSAVAREKRDRKSLHSGNVERSIIERERMRQQLSVDKEALARDFMVTRLQEIFDARAISAKDLALLKDFLALDYGRSLYIRLLKGQLKVGQDCTPVSTMAFDLLVDISTHMLSEAHKSADFSSPVTLISVASQLYFTDSNSKRVFLLSTLRGHPLWGNSHFWESAFFATVASEREQLPEHFTTKPVKWTALSEANQKAYKDQEDEVIFKILSKFGLNMLNLALSLEDTSRILRRFSILAELEGPRVDALMGVLDSIHRAISMTTSGGTVTVPIQKERMLLDYFSHSISTAHESERGIAKELYHKLMESQRTRSATRAKFNSTAFLRKSILGEAAAAELREFSKLPTKVSTETRGHIEIKTLSGHESPVECLSVDLSILASGCAGGSVILWDSRTGNCYRQLHGHTDKITCIAFNEDNLISGSQDHSLRVWDTQSGEQRLKLLSHKGSVACVHLDGNSVVSGSYDNTIKVWDVSAGAKPVMTLSHHTGVVNHVVVSGNMIYSASGDTTIKMWDRRKATKPVHTLSGHVDWVKNLMLDEAKDRLVSTSFDGTIRLWVPSTAECASVLSGHSGTVNSFDYRYPVIASGGSDGTVRIWNVEKGTCRILRGHASEVTRVCILDEERVASTSYDKTLRIWNTATSNPCLVLRGHSDWITTLQKTSDRIITGSLDCTIKVWAIPSASDVPLQVPPPSALSDGKKKPKKSTFGSLRKKKP